MPKVRILNFVEVFKYIDLLPAFPMAEKESWDTCLVDVIPWCQGGGGSSFSRTGDRSIHGGGIFRVRGRAVVRDSGKRISNRIIGGIRLVGVGRDGVAIIDDIRLVGVNRN